MERPLPEAWKRVCRFRNLCLRLLADDARRTGNEQFVHDDEHECIFQRRDVAAPPATRGPAGGGGAKRLLNVYKTHRAADRGQPLLACFTRAWKFVRCACESIRCSWRFLSKTDFVEFVIYGLVRRILMFKWDFLIIFCASIVV